MAFYRCGSSGGSGGFIPKGKAFQMLLTYATISCIDIPVGEQDYSGEGKMLFMNGNEVSSVTVRVTNATYRSHYRIIKIVGTTATLLYNDVNGTYDVSGCDTVVVGSLSNPAAGLVYLTINKA